MAEVYSGNLFHSGQALSTPSVPGRGPACKPPEYSAPPSRPGLRVPQRSDEYIEWQSDIEHRSQLERSPLVSAVAGLAKAPSGPKRGEERRPASPLNNMGLLSSGTDVVGSLDNLSVVVGLDKITVFIYGEWASPDKHDKYCPQGAKAIRADLLAAQEANLVKPFTVGVPVYGGTCYPARGHSIFGRKVRCPISIHVDGMRIALADIKPSNPSLPIGQVIIDSVALHSRGHHTCLLQLDVLLRGLGVVVHNLNVLRLDLCADVIGLESAPFLHLIHTGGCVITRFKWDKRGTYGPSDALETVMVGKSDDIRLQCYDKLKRFQTQIDEGKNREADVSWEAHVRRWGCVPSAVTRFEFQLSGKYLRARFARCTEPGEPVESVRTLSDTISRLDAIAEVLFTEQFRVADRRIDRQNKNHSRAGIHPVWQAIIDEVRQTDFGGNALSCECVQRIKREVRAKSVSRLEQDQRAILVRAAALVMPVEQIERMNGVEDWAELAGRIAISAGSGRSSEMREAAIAARQEWEARALLPDAGDAAFAESEVLGFNVAVDRVWDEPSPPDVPF